MKEKTPPKMVVAAVSALPKSAFRVERARDAAPKVVRGEVEGCGKAEELRVLVEGAGVREGVEIDRERGDERCEIGEERRHEEIEDDEHDGKKAEVDDDDRDDARDLAFARAPRCPARPRRR